MDAADAKTPEKPMVARVVYYSGNVQGVGFRAAVAVIARKHPVTGWVKNLADGRVQVVVEGTPQAVETFLEAVRGRWKDNVEKEKIEERPAEGKFKSFDVAY
jgi:acylphosphatase